MPLWCSADRIVATPAGCTPPPLGAELPEEDEAAQARRASCEPGTWQLGSTYSFSFHNAYFDMPAWRATPSIARPLHASARPARCCTPLRTSLPSCSPMHGRLDVGVPRRTVYLTLTCNPNPGPDPNPDPNPNRRP